MEKLTPGFFNVHISIFFRALLLIIWFRVLLPVTTGPHASFHTVFPKWDRITNNCRPFCNNVTVGAWDFPERSHAAKLMLGFPVKQYCLLIGFLLKHARLSVIICEFKHCFRRSTFERLNDVSVEKSSISYLTACDRRYFSKTGAEQNEYLADLSNKKHRAWNISIYNRNSTAAATSVRFANSSVIFPVNNLNNDIIGEL